MAYTVVAPLVTVSVDVEDTVAVSVESVTVAVTITASNVLLGPP